MPKHDGRRLAFVTLDRVWIADLHSAAPATDAGTRDDDRAVHEPRPNGSAQQYADEQLEAALHRAVRQRMPDRFIAPDIPALRKPPTVSPTIADRPQPHARASQSATV
jgi:hypothetical protein